MAKYSGVVRSITPSTTDDNWALEAGASESCKIGRIHWGGEASASTPMHTRTARSDSQTGATTVGNVAKLHPNSVTNVVAYALTFATTQPTLNAGDLFSESWNSYGGLVIWTATPGVDEFYLLGAATELGISNRNSVGTGVSSYGTVWEED